MLAPLSLILLLGACDSAPKENAAKPASDAKPKVATKADAKAEAKPDAKAEAQPDAKADAEPEAKPEPATPKAEFPALPADAVKLTPELLPAVLSAPKGAKFGQNINGWQDLTVGKDFAMVIRESFDDLATIKAELGEVKYVVDEPDTLVYQKGDGFGFVSIVEAKDPEDTEGESDRRFECRAGASMDWAISKKPKVYPRETVDLMVATCRTLKLPPIE